MSTAVLALTAYHSTVVTHKPEPGTQDADAKAHHVKGWFGHTVKYQNTHPSFTPLNFKDLAVALWHRATGQQPWPTPKPEDHVISVVTPNLLPSRTSSTKLRATWLGHACYYVEFPSGLRVLFDPVFEDHCAPVHFKDFKRFTDPPCDLSELPFVDAVFISHSHYDHLSYPSVQKIQKHFPNVHFFVGLGLQKWFEQGGIHKVTELDWWDGAEITLTPHRPTKVDTEPKDSASEASSPESITAKISCLPCQHGSGRGMLDQNSTLWCSWAVSSGEPAKSVWFGGDTGYRTVKRLPPGVDDYGDEFKDLPSCPQFRQIGERFGSFDLGLIPIGAYSPRFLFSCVHANPFDAVEIFRDTRCKNAMAIHWGTWVLTAEDVLEPPKLLKEALKRRDLPETGVFDICDIGETREF
ncbi:putative nape-hydrolyzing phospholipase d protein [Eutypa lata UCREL1]|uniref:Putative nape-hydrolyzing phospholipase d protein n=1 Tax=Eutypa lata (strain UCR-EL1) TaxID=1287681 RepID=M7TPU4_EUTLA|nr:putative nape-hydrolyzing phospholipase d protein [Eutypa lata UCREL1]